MNALEEKVCRCVDEMREEIIGFLQEIVGQASCNPPGDTRGVVRAICSKLESSQIPYETFLVDEVHESVVATINAGQSPNLLFNSHIDTVPVGEESRWTHGPFSGDIVDGRLYGRGSADAKGSVAPMIMAGKVLQLCGIQLNGSLSINPVADEEMGGAKGVKHLIDTGKLKPDMVVIGEITTNEIAIAEKGIIWLEFTSYGRTAHASTPWDGVNAISKMVKFLYLLEEELTERFAARRHPLTPPPSFNFGMIKGGVKANVVADQCKAVFDRRILPFETLEGTLDEVNEIIAKAQQEDPEIKIDVKVLDYGAPLETAPEEPFVQTALDVCKEFGIKNEPVGYQQASDGRFFSEMKIPTILLGPGDPSLAHSPNEFIPVEQVLQATKMYALLAMRSLGTIS
ncbi:MAG: M20 family metallopeptidase [Syntrophaceticus schinkii]|nr:M20 family metallopeptidase [Syntrophaceticus schinkii]